MRVLLLLITLGGCSTMTIRTGIAVVGGKPAFQASLDVGPAIMRTHHGIRATTEWGVATDERGTKMMVGANLDHMLIDPDEGPVMHAGIRFRGTGSLKESKSDDTDAFLFHGAAYTHLGNSMTNREKSGGFGVELGGGVARTAMRTAVDGSIYGKQTTIFEANILFHTHESID